MLLALGLGLYWFVEHQEAIEEPAAPMWGTMIVVGSRLLAALVGAWLVVSATQLGVAAVRLALAHLRTLWPQTGR
ncbi:MAG: hypothetical protein JO032_04435 [Alphaproteobacteria bacterium]|nr:hypothetical protein [Alphaproteobacteria bacterium]MBV9552023.1 hypothetical protein [Alphaproteobacteria bacterium]